jgi:hypothetical protein
MISIRWLGFLIALALNYVILEAICIIVKKISAGIIVMTKVVFFNIKMGKKIRKTRDPVTSKPLTKTQRTANERNKELTRW